MNVDDPRTVLRDALGISIATGAYGVSFGALATGSGLTVAQACALSVLTFTGASQFALVGILGAGGGAAAATVTAWTLGVRNTLYAVRLASLLGLSRPMERLVGAQFVIDETTAMALARTSQPALRLAFWATGAGIYLLWNAATMVGALAGAALGDPRRAGLDAAAPAAFLALLAPQLPDARSRLVALAAALLAIALVPLVPSGVPVLAAALVALVGGVRQAHR